jgi:hypothetical protein
LVPATQERPKLKLMKKGEATDSEVKSLFGLGLIL